MPTNLPPESQEAEKRYREATDPAEKIELLEAFIATIPKHKGTDHLRADLRRTLAKLKSEGQTKKKRSPQEPAFHIDKEGAGQVVLLGPTNVGKSALLAALTHAEPEISEAPYTTWKPMPGMMPIENIQVQLIDTPPLDRAYIEPLLFNLIRHADMILLVLDLPADPLKQLSNALLMLAEHRIAPQGWSQRLPVPERTIYLPLLIVTNKCDDETMDEDYEVFCELFEGECPVLPVSALTGRNFDMLKCAVFERLCIVRAYARPPGKEPDLERPFILQQGSTVLDLARKIHRDYYENLKSARVWGSATFDGQMVQRDYILHDGDIVELRI